MARDQKVKVRIQAKDEASREVAKAEGAFKRLGKSVKTNAVAIVAALGTIVAAFKGLQKAANLEAQTTALKRQLAEQGQAFDTFIAKMTAAGDAQVSQAEIISASSRALLLGIPAEQMADLMEIARSRAIALGTDVGKAFDDLTVGLARRSIPILDNLGFTTADLTRALETFATGLGTTTDKLTAQQQSAALLQGILDQGKISVEQFGNAQSELGRKLNQANAAMKDFGTFAGQVGSALTLALAASLGTFANAILFVVEGVAKAVGALTELLAKLPLVGAAFAAINGYAEQTVSVLSGLRESLSNFTTRASESADAMALMALGLGEIETKANMAAPAINDVSDAVSTLDDKLSAGVSSTDAYTQAQAGLEGQLHRTAAAANEAAAAGAGGSTDPGGLFPALSGSRTTIAANRGVAAQQLISSRGGAFVLEVGSKRVRLLPDGRIVFV